MHTYANDGVYTVQLIAISECGNDTAYLEMNLNSSGVENLNHQSSKIRTLNSGNFVVQLEDIVVSCELYDTFGKRVNKEMNPSGKEIALDLSDLENGVYFLRILFASSEITVELPLLK